jgi:GxxExxY protein
MNDDELGTLLIGCAIKVHRALGPGLLESVYETCLLHELTKTRLDVRRQVAVPFVYDGVRFDDGLKIDILFDNRLVVELKATEKLLPIHSAQLLTYLKLINLRVGYLLNFNVVRMREGGIKRLING